MISPFPGFMAAGRLISAIALKMGNYCIIEISYRK
jgi:hypothetical protein